MGTLQTELARLDLTKRSKQVKRVWDTKSWQSDYNWSEVEKELLATKEVKSENHGY